MKRKMTQDEILYAMWELVILTKGERGRFIRSQGWSVNEFDQELAVRTMAGEFRNGIYNPVIRPEIRAKYERIEEAVE
jgi:hypothetical protein